MQHAGVRFGILGPEESCTGDPARRIGNEYLWQTLAQQNIEVLNGYGFGKEAAAQTGRLAERPAMVRQTAHAAQWRCGVPAGSRLQREDGGGDLPALLQYHQE